MTSTVVQSDSVQSDSVRSDSVQSDLAARLAREAEDVRRSIELLGEILSDAKSGADEHVDSFLKRMLGAPPSSLAVESRNLTISFTASVGSVIGDLIAEHSPEIGPGEYSNPPSWSHVDLDGEMLSFPESVSAYFPAGTLVATDVIVRIADHPRRNNASMLWVYATADARAQAREVLERVLLTARQEKNFYRGRILHAQNHQGLHLQIVTVPVAGRDDLVLPTSVWAELDVNVAAVTTRAELLRKMGLGTSRGILIAGPPGVGKSAVCRMIGTELVGKFTVVIVDARAAAGVLRAVYAETVEWGPTVVILEDVDLYIGNRKRGGGDSTLADFLAVMDGTEQFEDVLTLASTNDPEALDKAATRAARFDAVIHLGYPDRRARVRILRHYVEALPHVDELDLESIADQLPDEVSGADLREIVRLSVLQHGSELTTGMIRRTIADGRWKPAPLTGQYL